MGNKKKHDYLVFYVDRYTDQSMQEIVSAYSGQQAAFLLKKARHPYKIMDVIRQPSDEDLAREEEEFYGEQPKCPHCGRLLTTSGECPVCDFGEQDLDETIVMKDPRDRRKKVTIPENIEEGINSATFKEWYDICKEYYNQRGIEKIYEPQDKVYKVLFTFDSKYGYPDKAFLKSFFNRFGVQNLKDVETELNGLGHSEYEYYKIEGSYELCLQASTGFRIYSISVGDLGRGAFMDTTIFENKENKPIKEEIKDILDKYHNEKNSNIYLFEVENSDGDFVEHFDDASIDFATFQEHMSEDGHKYYSFMISGGLNGSGEWGDYLNDIKRIFIEFQDKLHLDPVLYQLNTDIADDVWDGYVFLYENATEEQLNESLLYSDLEEGFKLRNALSRYFGQRKNLSSNPSGSEINKYNFKDKGKTVRYVIHHKDLDHTNNDPTNTIILRFKDHSELHQKVFEDILNLFEQDKIVQDLKSQGVTEEEIADYIQMLCDKEVIRKLKSKAKQIKNLAYLQGVLNKLGNQKQALINKYLAKLDKFKIDPKTGKVVKENYNVNIEHESIEKHDTLNPLLFDDEELKPEVKDTIENIADLFISQLEEDGIKFKLKDIVLIGSNVSYNYTKDSDLDVHLIADSEGLECPDDLYPLLYGAYRSMFNKNYDFTIKGIPVELYVEIDEPAARSNGIYSLLKGWVKKPEQKEIPELDKEAFNALFKEWEDKYFDLIGTERILTEEKSDDIYNFIEDLYDLRKESIMAEGEYGLGNLVFKEFRNLGYLDNLKDLCKKEKSKELSLEGMVE